MPTVLSCLLHYLTAFALSWLITWYLMSHIGFLAAYAIAIVASYFVTQLVLRSLFWTLEQIEGWHLPDHP